MPPHHHDTELTRHGSRHIVCVIDETARAAVDTTHANHVMVRGITAAADGTRIFVTNLFSCSVSVIDV